MTGCTRVSPPTGPLDATVLVPGSKSIANRALVCALLARGQSVLSNLPIGDDTAALVNVLEATGSMSRVDSRSVRVEPGAISRMPHRIESRLAGTTSRFMTAVATLCDHEVVVDGDDPLRRRPMGPLQSALRELGAAVTCLGEEGRLPVKVGSVPPIGGKVEIDGGVSSQFVTALMLIGPCLTDGVTIALRGDVVSRSYIEMTASVMGAFGANVVVEDRLVHVSNGGYSGANLQVEPDFSSAAFAVCAVLVRGGTVTIPGLPARSIQGDSRLLALAVMMGAEVTVDSAGVTVRKDPSRVTAPLDVDLRHESDLVPPLAVACAVAGGRSRLSGVGFIHAKESDRLAVMTTELNRLGARVRTVGDGLEIEGVGRLLPETVETHDDHRIAMSMAIAALSAGTVQIRDPEVVSKSWPDFFDSMAPLLGRPLPCE